ncbi:hypothetical protein GHO25_08855 [Pseudomonas sp. FSL R10-1350]|nr:hypothetical protein [Pseudomonas sp. FSL R10-1350]
MKVEICGNISHLNYEPKRYEINEDNDKFVLVPSVGVGVPVRIKCENRHTEDIIFYKENKEVHERLKSGEARTLIFNSRVNYRVEKIPLLERITIINLMDDINYWSRTYDIDVNNMSLEELKRAAVALEGGEKVMTLGGIRQQLDPTHGIHYTRINETAFLSNKTSIEVTAFDRGAADQRRWFATDCSLAIYPKDRRGWENNNHKKYDASKVLPLPDDSKLLCEYGISASGYLVFGWKSGPRAQWGYEWYDYVFSLAVPR